jgi:hypothetical protein
MFGLSQIEERLMLLIVIVCMALGGFFYIEHLGAQKCIKGQETANAAETRKEDIQRGKDESTVQKEGDTLEAAKTAPIATAPVVSLCPTFHSQARSAAATTEGKPNGETSDRTAAAELPSIRWDTEPIVRIGHEADAQITELQDYITNVCRPKS